MAKQKQLIFKEIRTGVYTVWSAIGEVRQGSVYKEDGKFIFHPCDSRLFNKELIAEIGLFLKGLK